MDQAARFTHVGLVFSPKLTLWFGLGHYIGGFPNGPFGLVQTGLLALLMGRAMLDTRGLGWPWIIHTAIDTVIFTFMVATAV